jgi:hypothetical protein
LEIALPISVSDVVVARRCRQKEALLNSHVLFEETVRKRSTLKTCCFVSLIEYRDVKRWQTASALRDDARRVVVLKTILVEELVFSKNLRTSVGSVST